MSSSTGVALIDFNGSVPYDTFLDVADCVESMTVHKVKDNKIVCFYGNDWMYCKKSSRRVTILSAEDKRVVGFPHSDPRAFLFQGKKVKLFFEKR